jgi:hypothetical protein
MTHIAKLFFNTNCQKDGSRVTDARQRGPTTKAQIIIKFFIYFVSMLTPNTMQDCHGKQLNFYVFSIVADFF